MLSITKTAEFLKIPKPRLYKLLETEGINTVQHGVRKLIHRDDIDRLAALVASEKQKKVEEQLLFSSEPLQQSTSNITSNSSTSSSVDNDLVQRLISEKDRQIQRLELQLDSEKTERQNLQQGLLNLQAVMMKLDQRISLLQEPEPKHDSEPVKSKSNFQDSEEAVLAEEKVDPVIFQKSSRNFATILLWVLVGLLGLATVANFTGFQLAEKLGEKLNRIVVSN